MEGFYRRQLRLFKLVSARHEAVRENSLGKRVFVVRIHVLCGVDEIVFRSCEVERPAVPVKLAETGMRPEIAGVRSGT